MCGKIGFESGKSNFFMIFFGTMISCVLSVHACFSVFLGELWLRSVKKIEILRLGSGEVRKDWKFGIRK
jgi:hypothetical protein